ncbi:Protein RTM1 [Colletotrichum sidae]|uniref:Protein RTM1 n=1 Tax=Colletotrichum sidae TaxID=1347389 RepID=A0A4R8TG07_9PEZI|nr:Protein RTM1 [Colletotrichum sidae]
MDAWSVWLFEPSLPAAVVATILYSVATAWITYLTCFKYRAWFFSCVPVGGLCQVTGYAMRSYSTQNHQNIVGSMSDPPRLSSFGSQIHGKIGIFASSTSLIVLAPIFIAAGNYLLIGRLIRAVLPPTHHKIFKIPARYLTRVYVSLDIVCMCVQSSGSSLASGVGWTGELADIGINILLAGLALQVLSFSTYLCILVRFHVLSRSMAEPRAPDGWHKVFRAVSISSSLILVRCIFRMVEFAEGQEGYSLQHEWMFWIFEGLLMIIALTVFCIWHPSRYLKP